MSEPKHRAKKGTCQLLIWDVPLGTKKRFKAACASQNYSMTEAIVQLMDAYSRNPRQFEKVERF
jgi:hypothetical protein